VKSVTVFIEEHNKDRCHNGIKYETEQPVKCGQCPWAYDEPQAETGKTEAQREQQKCSFVLFLYAYIFTVYIIPKSLHDGYLRFGLMGVRGDS